MWGAASGISSRWMHEGEGTRPSPSRCTYKENPRDRTQRLAEYCLTCWLGCGPKSEPCGVLEGEQPDASHSTVGSNQGGGNRPGWPPHVRGGDHDGVQFRAL